MIAVELLDRIGTVNDNTRRGRRVPHTLILAAALLLAAVVLAAGCSSRGNPVPGSCPIEGLTLPPGAVPNKLPDGICPEEQDKRKTRSNYYEREDTYRYFAIAFDADGGIDAVKKYFKLEAESVGYEETFDTSRLGYYRAGYQSCTGRKYLFVSRDGYSAFCLQRTRDFADDAEHDIGEYLLTAMLHIPNSGARPGGGNVF